MNIIVNITSLVINDIITKYRAFYLLFKVGRPNSTKQDTPSILPSITRFMALSLKYNDLLDIGHSIRDIAEYEGVDKSYILRIVKIAFLSPKIQEKILLLPRSLKYQSYMSAKELLKMAEIVGFGEQEGVFWCNLDSNKKEIIF